MHICHIAAEIAPIAKVGGLGDVVYGLGRETQRLGHPTVAIIPKYDVLEIEEIEDFSCCIDHFPIIFQGKEWSNTIWKGFIHGFEVYFIEPHHSAFYFERGCIYGCHDDVERFLYFSTVSWQLAKEYLETDIVHIHDWQTAIIAVLSENEKRAAASSESPPILLTIHNMEYQGRCNPNELKHLDLSLKDFYAPETMQDDLYPEALNLLKGGILFSDYITTVSPSYAEEVKQHPYGNGLENLLGKVKSKFCGILNGIDYEYWNPETDRFLPAPFSSQTHAKKSHSANLSNKGYVKKMLREHFMLDEGHRPILSVIARLVPQKGIDLIKYAIEAAVKKGGQFILLGSSPIPEIDKEFHELRRRYTDHPHVGITMQNQEALAHRIYGGSDLFIAPSLFEPCGLTQMIALRYGAIPIVRATGGLKDSIFDIDHDAPEADKANGYTFKEPSQMVFDQVLSRAIDCWYHQPDKWRQLMIHGMNHDFSWKTPAMKYVKKYEEIFKSAGCRP